MAVDVASLKVAELRAELKARDLGAPTIPRPSLRHLALTRDQDTKGLKAELAARLQEAIDGEGGAATEAEAEPAAAAEAETAAPAEELVVEADEAAAPTTDDAAPAEDGDDDPDVSTMTVAVLKDELKARGLPVSGKKAELQERLSEAVAATHAAEADALTAEAEVEAVAEPAETEPTSAPVEERKRKRDEPEEPEADMDVDSDEPGPPEPESRPSPPPNDAAPPSPKRVKLDAAPPAAAPPPPPSAPHPSERVYVPAPPPPASVERPIAEMAQAYVLDPTSTIDNVLAGLSDVTRALTTGKGAEIDLLGAELAQELRVPLSTLVRPIAFPSVDPWEQLSSLYIGFASTSGGDEPNMLATKLAGETIFGPLALVRYTPVSAGGPAERNSRSTSRADLAASIAAWAAADAEKRAKLVDSRFERMRLACLDAGGYSTDKAKKTEATLRRLLERA